MVGYVQDFFWAKPALQTCLICGERASHLTPRQPNPTGNQVQSHLVVLFCFTNQQRGSGVPWFPGGQVTFNDSRLLCQVHQHLLIQGSHRGVHVLGQLLPDLLHDIRLGKEWKGNHPQLSTDGEAIIDHQVGSLDGIRIPHRTKRECRRFLPTPV